MAIISVGYDGAVTESQWSDMIKKIGSAEYGVVGINDWKVTSVPAADRTIQISAGKGWGHGVFDENTAAVQIQLDSVASGSRYDLIVMRRNWTGAGGSSTFVKVNGTSVKEIASGRTKGPGVIDDQPIAIVRVDAGSTVVGSITDLRVWAGNGGLIANSDYALGYLDSLASSVFVNTNGKKYTRIIGADGNPLWTAGSPDGYLPLYGHAQALAGGVPPLGTNFLTQAGTTVQTFDNFGYARITFPKPFPNGLLYVSGINGDDYAQGGALFYSSAGSIFGAEGYGTKATWVYTGLSQPAAAGGGSETFSRSALGGRVHRINWIAIGW
jgi:hypothetical protein